MLAQMILCAINTMTYGLEGRHDVQRPSLQFTTYKCWSMYDVCRVLTSKVSGKARPIRTGGIAGVSVAANIGKEASE